MIKANDTLFIGGVVLFTTGSPQGNISFAGGINLEPYAVWIEKVINRHLKPIVSEQSNEIITMIKIETSHNILFVLKNASSTAQQ